VKRLFITVVLHYAESNGEGLPMLMSGVEGGNHKGVVLAEEIWGESGCACGSKSKFKLFSLAGCELSQLSMSRA
jgi:hypothetical protein